MEDDRTAQSLVPAGRLFSLDEERECRFGTILGDIVRIVFYNFFQILLSEGLDPLKLPGDPVVACIGPITARAAEMNEYQVKIIPEEYTIEGLLWAMEDYFMEKVNE